jgi:hypothetical protein
MDSVRDFLSSRLGVNVETRGSTAGSTIGATAAQVLKQDGRRIGFLFVNLSAVDMWVTPVGVPSSTNGIYVGPNGGNISLLSLEDGEVTAWEWLGVAAAAGASYFTLEALIGSQH